MKWCLPKRWFACCLLCIATSAMASEQFSPETMQFFENEIRPLLADQCFECHSARSEKLKGGLRLDHRDAILRGGDSGPSLVPGKPDESMLMEAVRYEGLEMPPDRKLSNADIAKLEKWIELGAPFPGGADAIAQDLEAFEITDEDRNYWAYQPIAKPSLPEVGNEAWNRHPIDQLIHARLESKDLRPNATASARQIIRRLYFDLIGLPPSVEQIEAFEKDPSDEALAKLVDHLLRLPQYGERWGRHWLDVVRFAQSNGYERDGEKPLVWRYRDFVIKSFNDDKPFDRFVMEQLAGDELPDATAESVTGTGFYRLGVWDDEPDDKRAAEFDGLDDMLSTVGQVFLGQTLGCARCHDHMFDPISQKDYYELLSFVRNVKYYENTRYDLTSATYAPLAPPAEVAAFAKEQEQRIAKLEADLAEGTLNQENFDNAIKSERESNGPFEDWTLAIREAGPKPKETFLLVRGDAGKPGERVEPRFMSVLGNQPAELPPSTAYGMSCGLRLQLARWVASPKNPLTARVIANRIWQHHFGRGIARTPNDLGKAGLPPTHPELLNWLAAELIENGWSIKHLHKQILLSQAWRMSSDAEGETARVDPANDLFWRQNMRRLDAEALRDSMLFVSGQLNTKMGGRGFFPSLSSEVVAAQSRPGDGWDVSKEAERNRRSVYIFTKRGVRDPLIESFDYVNTTSPLGVRPVTTVAPQALVLLNGRFVQRQALSLARRVVADIGDHSQTEIYKLYRRALGRDPTKRELQVAQAYLARQKAELESVNSVVSFRPDFPSALHSGFRKRLSANDYLLGPRETWSYHPGRWAGGYENIDALDEDRVPFALWNGVTIFDDDDISGKLLLQNATRFGSLLLNGTVEGEEFRGTEIRFDPSGRTVVAYRHTKEELQQIAKAEIAIPTSTWIDFRIVVHGGRAEIWLGDAKTSLLEVDTTLGENDLGGEAKFGVAANRGGISFDQLVVTTNGTRKYDLATYDIKSPSIKLQAMQSLGVVLMNTNEFLYVD